MTEQHTTNTEAVAYSDTMKGFLAAVANKSIKGIYLPSIELAEAVLAQMGEERLLEVSLQTELDEDYYFDYRNALPTDDILVFYRNNKDLAIEYIEGQAERCKAPSTIELIYDNVDKNYFKNMSLGLVLSSLSTPKHSDDSKLDSQFLSDSAYMATTHVVSTTCITMTAHAYAAYVRQLEF